MKVGKKTYLGDGVYARWEACRSLVLTTEDGLRPTNTIYLDSCVWSNLALLCDQVKKEGLEA